MRSITLGRIKQYSLVIGALIATGAAVAMFGSGLSSLRAAVIFPVQTALAQEIADRRSSDSLLTAEVTERIAGMEVRASERDSVIMGQNRMTARKLDLLIKVLRERGMDNLYVEP